jgi:Flp pilus assembly protein TadG
MRKSRKKSWGAWRRLARDTRGTEIAEAAVVLPMLFMILMAIFWFGQAFRIYGTLTQATRAGARAAVAPVCATCAAAGSSQGLIAQAAVQNAMAAAHLSTNQLVPTGAAWTTPAPTLYQCRQSPLTPVACDATVTSVCVQENVQLSFPAPVSGPAGMGECGTSVSVRYKYPFHFSIPFTNLDLANIQLPGQAQMRAEAQ